MEDIVQGSDGYFTVCVKNYISKNTFEIEEFFSQFGAVVSVRTIEKDPRLAFVRYMYKEEVMKCFETTKNDPIYQVSMANTRPRGGNTAGCEQPHVKPCGLNQPVSQYLQRQDKQQKSAPSGDTERDKHQKSAPTGDTERDGRRKPRPCGGPVRDKHQKSAPTGHTERDERQKPRPCGGPVRDKHQKSAPSGHTERDERRKPRPCGGPVREENWDSGNSGNEENEENWDADTKECDKYSLLGASGKTNGENFNVMEASGRTSGEEHSIFGASGSTNGGPSQDTKSNKSSRLGGGEDASSIGKNHPGIDIVVVANLPDDIRPRDMYVLCYDADPLFISRFERVESGNHSLYCVVHLDKKTADDLVKKLNGKTLKGKLLIALRLEK